MSTPGSEWAALGFTPTTALYFVAGLLGGVARVLRCHGVKGLKSRFAPMDLAFTAAGGVVYPYLLPGVVTAHIPPLVIALFLAWVTYMANSALVTLARKVGLLPPNGKPDDTIGGTP